MADYPDWGSAQPVIIYIDPGDDTGPQRLRTKNGLLQVQSGEPVPQNFRGGSVLVSTLTHLTDWIDLGYSYEDLLFFLSTDDANNVNFLVETSQDGTHADVNQRISVATQGTQASVEVLGSIARFYRLSAYTDNPFPTSRISWGISGTSRVGA